MAEPYRHPDGPEAVLLFTSIRDAVSFGFDLARRVGHGEVGVFAAPQPHPDSFVALRASMIPDAPPREPCFIDIVLHRNGPGMGRWRATIVDAASGAEIGAGTP